mgnify:FL=1
MPGVLDGIRVLDFGRYIAGPWCAALLGDLGAEVIRVEKVDGGEDRFNYEIGDEPGSGSMFLQCNRNKKGVTLNPTKPEGREIQEKLIATADVVIANMPPRALEQLGLDYENLKAIKPDIILVTNTAFGTIGPYAKKVGFDSVAQAMSGNMIMSGSPGEPAKSFGPYVDYGTAGLCAFGTMAAIMHRNATGEGQEVQGALLATALMTTNSIMSEEHVTRRGRVPTGNRGQVSAPSDLFKTKDGYIYVICAGQPMFERWARLMGDNHWLTEGRFENDDGRAENGAEISARMQQWCDKKTTEEAMDILEEHRIPVGPVYNLEQALEDPHIQASGMLTEVDYPGLSKPAPITSTPVRMLGSPGEIRHRAPTLGEHTNEIFSALGYDGGALAALREKRVI